MNGPRDIKLEIEISVQFTLARRDSSGKKKVSALSSDALHFLKCEKEAQLLSYYYYCCKEDIYVLSFLYD